MKFATLKNGTPDGVLLLVSRDLRKAVQVDHLASTLQAAIERWDSLYNQFAELYQALNDGTLAETLDFAQQQVMAPMPRSWQWLDGSLFLSHGELMQQAFHLDPTDNADTIPLIYQGAGDDFIGPYDDIPLPSESHCIDFEGEFAVIVDEVPMGTPADNALEHVRLLMLVNDVSLRAMAVREMNTGFGFIQAKPASSFSAVAITPDELGEHWQDGRIHLPLHVAWNDKWFGHPHGGAMHFGFHQLIAHAALTRRLSAGTILGSGTVSNHDRSVGSACISERRAIDQIEFGEIRTGYMQFGDRIHMHATLPDGTQPFGAIDQKITRSPALQAGENY
ncbi:MAG: fumarylacetoacetate hydrolase [Gammaproteobacteria bacterium]|nr:fumarylacetoacetate hydrolase [Gammaproteobacteria bacterium]